MNPIIIRTDNGDFDLQGTEKIVQSFGIFSFQDLTARSGEYSNTFELPYTNNNINILKFANYINATNILPYQKIEVEILVFGTPFKKGFLEVDSIKETIKCRFYSGNTNFYNLIKNQYLSDLDWSTYDHVWNLANALIAADSVEGYTYPVMDYGGQTLAGDIVDIRKILPSTSNKTIFEKLIADNDYTYVLNFDYADFFKSWLPYSKKNPEYSAEYLLLNSVDASNTNSQFPTLVNSFAPNTTTANPLVISWTNTLTPAGFLQWDRYANISFNSFVTGSSSYFNNNIFLCNQSGNYSFSLFIDLATFNYVSQSTVYTPAGTSVFTIIQSTYIQFIKRVGNTDFLYQSEQITTGTTITGSIYLNAGESFFVNFRSNGYMTSAYAGSGVTTITFAPEILDTINLTIDLDPELVFTGLITYKSMLPKIKCSDWLKDMCIRFGLLLAINEDTKVVTVNQIDALIDNIPNSIDLNK